MTMANEKKSHGAAVARILKRSTREHVGYLYQWNTGEKQDGWFSDTIEDVIYEPLDPKDCKIGRNPGDRPDDDTGTGGKPELDAPD
ncbi:hypothetical protein [Notoacmeibacter ruber]|uniref:Uncharacterized protein n=1 Tax=Notoacmeibacter ruber TaxID=2670375 RepID=A0A3L7J2X3_9HYPH|nr:hypothetical protein [Notoacmeibacter ruber]RLQ84973.1 hypothetical protein D8780_15410 [Notoacmeibacter ruber]